MKIMVGGELFVPKIPSLRIMDLAKAIAPKAKIKITGLRPGEKIHEEMITETDGLSTYEFKDYFVITSDFKYTLVAKKGLTNHLISMGGKKCKRGFSYKSNSNKTFLTISQIKKILKKN